MNYQIEYGAEYRRVYYECKKSVSYTFQAHTLSYLLSSLIAPIECPYSPYHSAYLEL